MGNEIAGLVQESLLDMDIIHRYVVLTDDLIIIRFQYFDGLHIFANISIHLGV
tara:strand:- start:604 stop:762 length:159 start_codon:yes stop_codon:yes gene_type:complete